MMTIYSIEQSEPDDPYGDIVIKRGFARVIKLPLDDAPVHDFNASQRNLARRIVGFLNNPPPAEST